MLSHVGRGNLPRMVDVGDKPVTRRTAQARARVSLPAEIVALLQEGELRTAKGPVFNTAIVAGVMAAKKTHELIPFCHPLALDDCRIAIALNGDREAVIDCTVSVTHRTGVEMEALTGASVAALTIYDMCKALSHDIVIRDIRLIRKEGGKSDFSRIDPAMPG